MLCYCETKRHYSGIVLLFRSSSFPPSYEESQRGQVCPDGLHEVVVSADAVGMVMSLAPPLYSRDSSEAPNCMWSWEQPPQYSQAVQTQPGQTYAGDQREASSADWRAVTPLLLKKSGTKRWLKRGMTLRLKEHSRKTGNSLSYWTAQPRKMVNHGSLLNLHPVCVDSVDLVLMVFTELQPVGFSGV